MKFLRFFQPAGPLPDAVGYFGGETVVELAGKQDELSAMMGFVSNKVV